jgi:hypothetical protein
MKISIFKQAEEHVLALVRPYLGRPFTRTTALGLAHALNPLVGSYRCRECGIAHIEPGMEIDGEPLCWADEDLCSRCQDALQEELERDAARYRWLRNRPTRPGDIAAGGVFAGRTPDNVILGGEDLDRAIDFDAGGLKPIGKTLEARLADCLAACIDEPLLVGAAEIGGIANPKPEIFLRFFRPDLSERAAELLEEAGR